MGEVFRHEDCFLKKQRALCVEKIEKFHLPMFLFNVKDQISMLCPRVQQLMSADQLRFPSTLF